MSIDPSKGLSSQRNLSKEQNTVCGAAAYYRAVNKHDVDAFVEDVECAVTATETFLPQSDARFFHVLRYVSLLIFDKIVRSNGFGCCDKPDGMPRFQYWFQRLDFACIESAIENLATKPPVRVFEINKKPPSSSPKCSACKAKFTRGEQMVIERRIVLPMNPEQMEIRWRADPYRKYHAKCAGEPREQMHD